MGALRAEEKDAASLPVYVAMSDATRPNDEFAPEEQARIQAHIRARGMTFEVFLPESLANWLRAKLDYDGRGKDHRRPTEPRGRDAEIEVIFPAVSVTRGVIADMAKELRQEFSSLPKE